MNLDALLPLRQVSWFFPINRKLLGSSFGFILAVLALPAVCLARDINWGSLNLTPQQETQINGLENSWEKTHAEIGSQIEHDMMELRAILPTGDTQRIRQLQNRISSNKMYLMNQSMETFLKKRETLTPGQRTQLQKMLPGKAE